MPVDPFGTGMYCCQKTLISDVTRTVLTRLFAVIHPTRRQPPAGRLNQPLGLASSAANGQLLDDSWQDTWRGLKNPPTELTAQEDKTVASQANGGVGDLEDGMGKISTVSLRAKAVEMEVWIYCFARPSYVPRIATVVRGETLFLSEKICTTRTRL